MTVISEHGMVVDPERPWLGGYFPEGDPASHCPELWEWAIDRYKIKSVLDVGCGSGLALNWFQDHGVMAMGVDGLPPSWRTTDILTHDYTLRPYVPEYQFDLAWCCEFVEHVREEFVDNFLATFQRCRIVMMTHGLFWQDGHHHVNLKPSGYWIEKVRAAGFKFLARDSIESRDMVLQQYWRNSGLIFRRA